MSHTHGKYRYMNFYQQQQQTNEAQPILYGRQHYKMYTKCILVGRKRKQCYTMVKRLMRDRN